MYFKSGGVEGTGILLLSGNLVLAFHICNPFEQRLLPTRSFTGIIALIC